LEHPDDVVAERQSGQSAPGHFDGAELDQFVSDFRNGKSVGPGVGRPGQRVTSQDASSEPIASQQSVSRETPQAGETDEDEIHTFVQQHREASTIVEPQADELKGLSTQVKGIDPHLSDALAGIAD
jgi:hypothetical protein